MFGNPIKFSEALTRFNLTESGLNRLIQQYGIVGFGASGKSRILNEHAIFTALNLRFAKIEYYRHLHEGQDAWQRYCLDIRYKHDNPLYAILPKDFEADDYRGVGLNIQDPAILKDLATIGNKSVEPITKETALKGKKLKEMQPVDKGDFQFGKINIHCKTCRLEFTGKELCEHTARQSYIVTLNVDRKRKKLSSRYKIEAIGEAEKFYNEYISGGASSPTPILETPKFTLLKDAVEWFIQLKTPDPTDPYKIKGVSDGHRTELKRALNYMVNCLTEHKFTTLKSIENEEVCRMVFRKLLSEIYHAPTKAEIKAAFKRGEHLQRLKGKKDGDPMYGAKTINKYMGHYSSFVNHINKKLNLGIINKFAAMDGLEEPIEAKAISPNKFQQLIEFIDTKPNVSGINVKVSNNDLPWLKRAFILEHALCGRRKDIVNLKWNNIKWDEENECYVFEMRINKATTLRKKRKEPTIQYPAITHALMKHLIEWGIENKIDTDDFIIQGKEEQALLPRKQSRVRLEEKISAAFTVLGKLKFGNDFNLTNRSVRKGGTTGNAVRLGDNAYKETHSSKNIFMTRYVDAYQLGVQSAEKQKKLKIA